MRVCLVWFSFLSWVVVVSACLLSGAQRLRASERIGFIGDGYSLGAGAKGEFDYTPGSLVKTLDRSYTTAPSSMVAPNLAQMGIREWLPPQVLWPSLREKKDPFWWVVQHFLHGVYSEFFNTPEYGWSSLLAGSLGYDAQGVYIAAENTAKVGDFVRLSNRLLGRLQNTLPERLFVLFTAQDLCSLRFEQVTSGESFGDSIRLGLENLLKNGRAPDRGSEIIVIGYLGLAQLLSDPGILGQKMNSSHGQETCQERRKKGFYMEPVGTKSQQSFPAEKLFMQNVLPPNPVRMCPTLFDHENFARAELSIFSRGRGPATEKLIAASVEEKVSFIATRIRLYRDETKRAVKSVVEGKSALLKRRNISIRYIDTSEFLFQGSDLAPDCFNMKLTGHAKIARFISRQTKKIVVTN